MKAMQCREIGESDWVNCSKERYDYCNKSPEHDTRILSKESNPVKRLHNLCDMLQEQQDESPYSADSWSELEAENERLRVELKQLVVIHEKCSSELWDLKNQNT